MHCYSHPPSVSPKESDSAEVLLGVGRLIGQEVNLDAFLQTLVDRVAALMQADRGTLYLLDPARDELFSRAAHLPELRQIRLKLGQGVAGHVGKTGETVNVPDPTGERRFFADIDKLTGYRTQSLLAVPLRDRGGELFGVLQVLNRRNGPRFTDDDAALLTRIADQVSNALEATSLYAELRRAREQPQAPVGYFFNRVIGESAPMKAAYALVQKAAGTDATVLIRGESGCGKEMFARALHVNSPRRERPLVKVDCAALPASLIENELFGHEKGAFTGADARMEGKFEAADGGTVFIDELGELPLSVQGKLLRVLQDREFERVGGTRTLKVDVRIVAATNRDLTKLVAEGKFREDLYYRVRVVELVLPPLRDRGPEDIERLARHFVASASRKHRLSTPPRLTAPAVERLQHYRWPGNVRELEHCIESAVVLSDGEIRPENLPLAAASMAPTPRAEGGTLRALSEVEREHILAVLAAVGHNRSQAAKVLGIGRNTLGRKLKEYGLPEDA
jgi:Nif-specific regulatory protein